jgi:hypothetical protein
LHKKHNTILTEAQSPTLPPSTSHLPNIKFIFIHFDVCQQCQVSLFLMPLVIPHHHRPKNLVSDSSDIISTFDLDNEYKHLDTVEFADLAIIDLSKAKTEEGRAALVQQVREAMTTNGFFYVVNHGYTQAQVGEIYRFPLLFHLLLNMFSIIYQLCLPVHLPHYIGRCSVTACLTLPIWHSRTSPLEKNRDLRARTRHATMDISCVNFG